MIYSGYDRNNFNIQNITNKTPKFNLVYSSDYTSLVIDGWTSLTPFDVTNSPRQIYLSLG